MLRKPMLLVFREDRLAIGLDVEDAVRPFDELDVEAELLLDRGRQTGGLR